MNRKESVFVSFLLSLALAGCNVLQPDTQPARTPPAAPVSQPQQPQPQSTGPEAAAPPQAGIPAAHLLWSFDAPGAIEEIGVSGREVVLLTTADQSDALLRLDTLGKAVAPTLVVGGHIDVINGWLGNATPDFGRILVFTDKLKAKVINRAGETLWQGSRPSPGKAGSHLYLLPDGKTLLNDISDAGVVYEAAAFDLSGKPLWQTKYDQSGMLLHATAEEIVLGNDNIIWRSKYDGTDRKVLPMAGLDEEWPSFSTDGSTIVRVDQKGVGHIYDANGMELAQWPSGEIRGISSNGQQILVETAIGSYALLNRQGRTLWQLAHDQRPYVAQLSPDGAFFVTVTGPTPPFRVTLYDQKGLPVWQSELPMSAKIRSASAFVDSASRLVYVSLEQQLYALPLSVK
ncbi:MAG: PQQ-binding-like beta-propeller repeat protein [Mycobacterium leprae]